MTAIVESQCQFVDILQLYVKYIVFVLVLAVVPSWLKKTVLHDYLTIVL